LSSQGPHAIRDVLAEILHLEKQMLRVVTPDVGGGFGTKLFPYREYALAAFAAKLLHEAVTWIADRSEHFLGDTQGRDNVATARLALDEKHRFLALDVDLVADMGALRYAPAPGRKQRICVCPSVLMYGQTTAGPNLFGSVTTALSGTTSHPLCRRTR
jgi:carbon-monoxide dehydrogenase large subunit